MSYEHSQGCKHGRWKGRAPHRAHTHLVRRRKLSGTKVDDSKDRAIVLIQLTAARESDNRRRAPASCCVHEHVEVGVGNARATRQIHRAGTRNLARAPTRHDKENYSATTRPCCHPSRNAYFDTAVMRVCAPREGRKRRCQEGPASSTSNKCRGGRSSHCVKSTSHAKTLCRTHTHTHTHNPAYIIGVGARAVRWRKQRGRKRRRDVGVLARRERGGVGRALSAAGPSRSAVSRREQCTGYTETSFPHKMQGVGRHHNRHRQQHVTARTPQSSTGKTTAARSTDQPKATPSPW